jgi:hypothetical protein
MSGGAHNMKHSVEVGAVPPPQPPTLDELDQAELLQHMQVPLDGPYRTAQGPGQGLHLGPAQAGLVVGVVCEGAVGGDRLCRDSGQDQIAHLWYAGKFGLRWHRRLLFLVRRCASMIEFIKEAAGIRSKMSPAAFSMLLSGK